MFLNKNKPRKKFLTEYILYLITLEPRETDLYLRI